MIILTRTMRGVAYGPGNPYGSTCSHCQIYIHRKQ